MPVLKGAIRAESGCFCGKRCNGDQHPASGRHLRLCLYMLVQAVDHTAFIVKTVLDDIEQQIVAIRIMAL